MNRLLVFNPGHEEALTCSTDQKYTPPKSIRKMMQQLSLLMLAFAEEGDYIYVPNEDYNGATIINHHGELVPDAKQLPPLRLHLWALEPHIIRHIEQWANKVGIQIIVPHISKQYLSISHRKSATSLLKVLHQQHPTLCPSPDIIPHWITGQGCDLSIEQIKSLCLDIAQHSNKQDIIIKRPFTSSGRGVYPLSTPITTEQAQTIIQQSISHGISIEPRLDCYQDYALLLEVSKANVSVLGYSKFSTDTTRGTNYTGNILISQDTIREELIQILDNNPQTLHSLELSISQYLSNKLLGSYEGYIGVDMFAYTTPNGEIRLHPCVEINPRCTMGVLAKELYRKHLSAQSQGIYRLDFFKTIEESQAFNHTMIRQYPEQFDAGGKLRRGYRALTPTGNHFLAYILVEEF